MIFLALDFHYIDDEDRYPNGGIYPVSPQRFAHQLDELAKHFKFISQSELLEAIKNKKELPERCCMITFDDGLRCQYDIALPILKEKSIPAVFFVGSLPHLERKAYLVHKIHWTRANLSSIDFLEHLNEKLRFVFGREIGEILSEDNKKTAHSKYRYDGDLESEIKFFLNNILDDEKKEEIIGSIFKEIVRDEDDFVEKFYLTENQIRDLGYMGYLGLHSYEHKPLAKLTESEIMENISKNKKHLEFLAGSEIYSISYPYGSKFEVNENVVDVCKRAGLKIGFTKERSFNNTLKDPMLFARADTNDVLGGKSPVFEMNDLGAIKITGDFSFQREVFIKEDIYKN